MLHFVERNSLMKVVRVCFPLTMAFLLSGCGGGTTSGGAVTTVQAFDFNAGMQGWTSDVSDLPANYDNSQYQISYSVAALPAPLDTTKKALRLTSFNQSDDLWQFVKRQISGLKANTRYNVRFDVEIASDAPESSAGVGGSPGGSVVVKVGGAQSEPNVKVEGDGRVFTLDKGNNFNEGTQARNVGSVGISGEEFVYQLKQLNNASRSFPVTTDSNGQVWVFVGTDSGYEGQKTLYYTQIKLTFSPVVSSL